MNGKDNIVKRKSFEFAVKSVKQYKLICGERKEFVLSKQFLRSGTSIGANVREAINAQSSADFIHKFHIAQKECDETIYWIELLKETNYISNNEFETLNKDATELLRIIRSNILSTMQKLNNS